ncbi:MAG: 3-phosphoshikimate 1-carboxyvinyltransferase [Ruminococcus sp.]|nr:3-phosphoshikimate 1-carboxyvinyltransferase [Ruminococcus sp.]
MDIKITPNRLSGKVTVPPSKSVAHRLIICAAFADGRSVIENIAPSKDIIATASAMKAFGADITLKDGKAYVDGTGEIPKKAVVDCCESGSTLRFLIPVATALGIETEFHGEGKLPERPITPYLEALPCHNVSFDYNNTMPFSVSGKMTAGLYKIGGDISSQFITGLMLGLSLLDEDSEIELTSHLESKPYVDITIDAMNKFGVVISETKNGYYIKGGQKYKLCSMVCEGDYSQSAFFYVANSLGGNVSISGLSEESAQGDKKIVEICKEIVYNKKGSLKPFKLDCSDIPDLVPILTVLGCFCDGVSEIYNVSRLRIKECDRLEAISECLNKLGGKVEAFTDKLVITGVEKLSGGEVSSYNDHRIAMSMAIASQKCTESLIIRDAQCVSKSYPDFWQVFKSLGGVFIEI